MSSLWWISSASNLWVFYMVFYVGLIYVCVCVCVCIMYIYIWKIPWMEEPGGLQSMGSPRVGHD